MSKIDNIPPNFVLISEYVRKLRKESGLSANEFAKLHGVSHSQINLIWMDL